MKVVQRMPVGSFQIQHCLPFYPISFIIVGAFYIFMYAHTYFSELFNTKVHTSWPFTPKYC